MSAALRGAVIIVVSQVFDGNGGDGAPPSSRCRIILTNIYKTLPRPLARQTLILVTAAAPFRPEMYMPTYFGLIGLHPARERRMVDAIGLEPTTPCV